MAWAKQTEKSSWDTRLKLISCGGKIVEAKKHFAFGAVRVAHGKSDFSASDISSEQHRTCRIGKFAGMQLNRTRSIEAEIMRFGTRFSVFAIFFNCSNLIQHQSSKFFILNILLAAQKVRKAWKSMNFQIVHFLAFLCGLGTRPFPSTLKGVAYLPKESISCKTSRMHETDIEPIFH